MAEKIWELWKKIKKAVEEKDDETLRSLYDEFNRDFKEPYSNEALAVKLFTENRLLS